MARNSEVLKSFVAYCEAHPEMRFWQALRNWSGYGFIFAADQNVIGTREINLRDTFYWEDQRDSNDSFSAR